MFLSSESNSSKLTQPKGISQKSKNNLDLQLAMEGRQG